MKKGIFLNGFFIVTVFIFTVALSGFSQDEKPVAPVFTSSSKIGVMPFLKGKYDINLEEPLDKILTCTIEQLCYFSEDILPGAEKKLTRFTQSALATRLGDQMLPKDIVSETAMKLMPYPSEATPKSIALETGKSIGADFVLVGAVWRYKNRTTVSGAPDQPASVAFVVYLLETASGRTIWKNKFIKIQTALTDDISNAPMFFKGGMKWLTADELAEYGVNVVFKNFPFAHHP